MSFTPFALSKTWESAEDFPTYEAEEAKVRSDMQCLYTELELGLQGLIGELEATGVGASGAKSLGIEPIASLPGVNNVLDALTGIIDLLTNAQLPQSGVDTENLVDGAVTTAKLASGAVTGAKCDFTNGLTVAGNLTVGGSASITGGFTAGSTVFLAENVSYGNNLPPNANASKGRIFFKKLT